MIEAALFGSSPEGEAEGGRGGTDRGRGDQHSGDGVPKVFGYASKGRAMTIEQAAAELAKMYKGGLVSREQALSVHLFGIKHADEIAGMSLPELAARAGIPKAYATELRKGINLARYVVLK
jgi:hypothetical protein